MPPPTQPITFAPLLPLNQTTPSTYTLTLSDSFCVGTVPNGGYITSAFLLAARTHMTLTHPTRSTRDPMNLHLEFLRRTSSGPATFTVRDLKLGSRISNLHLTLSQHREANDPDTPMQVEVEGYITLTDLSHESGLSNDTGYKLLPPPLPVSLPALSNNTDKNYIMRRKDPYGNFRRATLHCEMYLVRPPRRPEGSSLAVADQWVRFRPLASAIPSTTTPPSSSPPSLSSWNLVSALKSNREIKTVPGRWTNDSLGYIVDIFPQLNERFNNREIEDAMLTPESDISDAQIQDLVRAQKQDRLASGDAAGTSGPDGGGGGGEPTAAPVRTYWYPTLLLNLDVKKLLPEEGVEWLFVRVQAKKIEKGRFDLDVEVWDEAGELVALSTHASLILDASRNITRSTAVGKKEKKESKI